MTDWQFMKQKRRKRLSKAEAIKQYQIERLGRLEREKPIEEGSFDEKAAIERLWRK